MNHYTDRLNNVIRRKGNTVLVGIDPRQDLLPEEILKHCAGKPSEAFRLFGRDVIDAVAEKAPAVKFQSAFYEALGPVGLVVLAELMRYAKDRGLIVIFDGKRNDIGSTAEAYAEAYLGHDDSIVWYADAITVNPYLGTDGIRPFVDVAKREGKGVYVLVRTSNPSAREFQDLVSDGRPIYRHVAERVVRWGKGTQGIDGDLAVGAVVGATYPTELAELREAMPRVPLLVPGYGAQGGGALDVEAAFDSRGLGALINSSRGIIFAYKKPEYQDQARTQWQSAVEQAVVDMAAELDQWTRMKNLKNSSLNT